VAIDNESNFVFDRSPLAILCQGDWRRTLMNYNNVVTGRRKKIHLPEAWECLLNGIVVLPSGVPKMIRKNGR